MAELKSHIKEFPKENLFACNSRGRTYRPGLLAAENQTGRAGLGRHRQGVYRS